MGTGANVIQTALGQSQIDLRKDFQPVGNITTIKYILVVHPTVPAQSLAELIAYAKANPGRLNFVSGGLGTPPHLGAGLALGRPSFGIRESRHRAQA